MLVNQGFDLVVVLIVDLSDLAAHRDRLSEHHIDEAQLAVNRGFDGEILFPVPYHLHVKPHVLQAFAHLPDLHRPVEAVLLGAVLHQPEAVLGQLVILLGLQKQLLGDEIVLIERLLRLVSAFLAAHLHLQLQFLLLEAQLLLFHLDHRVAEDVLLLGEVGLSVENLHVETLVAEDQDDVALADVRALLRDDCLHHAALQRAELHSGHRYHAPADADVVVELAASHLADGDCFSAHTQFPGVVAQCQPPDEDE